MAPLKQHQEWQPGDDPQSHPLWAEQAELELAMTTLGSDRYWARVQDAMDPGASPKRPSQGSGSMPPEMSRVPAFRRKVDELVPKVAEALRAWLKEGHRDKRKADSAHAPLQMLQPEVAAFIAIRAIIDRAAVSQMMLLGVAIHIGAEVENQARMLAWVGYEEHLSPQERLFGGIRNNLKRQHSTARHVRRVNINRFNKLMRVEVRWQDWDRNTQIKVGLRMVDLIVTTLDDFNVEADQQWDAPATSKRRKAPYKAPNVITVSDGLMGELEDRVHRDAASSPVWMPTLMPPKRWDGMRGGGYYSPCVRPLSLIRHTKIGERERREVSAEFDALDMPRAYQAINAIQETPWCINEKVHAVAKAIWDEDLGFAGIIKREAKPLPPRPINWEQCSERERKDWKAVAAKVHGENARRGTKAAAVSETLRVADYFHRREFYFPHRIDFRGRMYPVPAHLQPQGSDLARGLLSFAYGRPIGDEGADWLAVHVANCYGHDKLTFEDRKAWVVRNEHMLRSIAKSPLRDRRWVTEADSKSQWQALAATFEWVRYLDTGPTMVSAFPIRVDGTCNGIQHLAAIMRDEVVGERVNLLPGDQRRDIYIDVAAALQARLEVIVEGAGHEGWMATQWLRAFEGTIPRSFTKQPVMGMPFGATRESRKDGIWEWLNDNDAADVCFSDDERGRAVQWLLKHLESVMDSVLAGPRSCMAWFEKCSQALSEAGQTAVWQTPSGFVVRHAYRKTTRKQFEVLVDGRRIQIRDESLTGELDASGQRKGLAPNFAHSMDASANMETLVAIAGLPDPMPITAIHDAFGSIPARMPELSAILRQAFVDVHRQDVMAEFRNGCVVLIRDHIFATQWVDWTAAGEMAERRVPALPPRGRLDVGQVVGSRYFFS